MSFCPRDQKYFQHLGVHQYQLFLNGTEKDLCYTLLSVGPDSGVESTLREFVFCSLSPEPSIHTSCATEISTRK